MADLASWPRTLAVVVPVQAGNGQGAGAVGQVADQVEHGAGLDQAGLAQRQAEHGAQMVFELAGGRALDGPVPGIVHPRRHFVAQQAAIVLEQFQREHADIAQFLGDGAGVADGLVGQGRWQPGLRHAQ